jgi:hypothetical protein
MASLAAELEAFAILRVDIVVTVDDLLLELRASPDLIGLNVMTPEEAMVVVGVWTRTIHEAFITHAKVSNGLYHWAAARAVVPAAWPSYCAFVYGRYDLPDGGELTDLAGSTSTMSRRCCGPLTGSWACGTAQRTTRPTTSSRSRSRSS